MLVAFRLSMWLNYDLIWYNYVIWFKWFQTALLAENSDKIVKLMKELWFLNSPRRFNADVDRRAHFVRVRQRRGERRVHGSHQDTFPAKISYFIQLMWLRKGPTKLPKTTNSFMNGIINDIRANDASSEALRWKICFPATPSVWDAAKLTKGWY